MSNASIRMLQSATGPATPAAGYTTLWAGTDDNFYVTKDTGVTVGLQGTSGSSGSSGNSGSSGSSGNSGTSGSSGSSGAAGTSGSSGSSGNSGTSGSSGSSGNSGTSGSSGSSGAAGTSGSSGSSGAAGTSGSSGSSGNSGTSGVDGLGLRGKNIAIDASDFVYDSINGWSDAVITFASPFGSTNYSVDLQWNEDPSQPSSYSWVDLGIAGFQNISITNKTASSVTIRFMTVDVPTTYPNLVGYVQCLALLETGVDGTSGSSGSSGVSGTSGSSGSSGGAGATGAAGTSGSSGSSGLSGTPSPISEVYLNTLVSDAIGATAGSGGNESIIIGATACNGTGTKQNIIIGSGAKVCCDALNSYSNIIIGTNASTVDNADGGQGRNIVIGHNAKATFDGGNFVIGRDSCVASSGGFDTGRLSGVVGALSCSTGWGTFTFGSLSCAVQDYSAVMGGSSRSLAGGSSILGSFNLICCGGHCGTALGYSNTVHKRGGIAIGSGNINCFCDSVLLGSSNQPPPTEGTANIMIGCCNNLSATATCPVTNNIQIGSNTCICGSGAMCPDGNIAIGTNALVCVAGANCGIAIGHGAKIGRGRGISIGVNACSVDGDGTDGIAIGFNAKVTTEIAIAIGHSACAASYSVAMGYATQTAGLGSVSLGQSSRAICRAAIALGDTTISCNCGSVAFGLCATACHDFAYVLSACKTSERANTVHVNHLLADGQGVSKIHAIGSTGGASAVVDWDNGNNQTVTLTSNTTFAFCNPICGGNYALVIEQGGSGSYCVTWPGTVKWAGATGPTLSTAIGDIDMTNFIYDGTNYYGYAQCNFG